MSDSRRAAARRNGRLGGRPKSTAETTERASIRIRPSDREVIEQAAAVDGQSWSSWMIAAAVEVARQVVTTRPDSSQSTET